MTGLLAALDGDDAVDALVDDAALVRALLRVETELAGALVDAGIAPAGVDDAVRDACDRAAAALDPAAVDALGRRSRGSGNPVVPLVADLVAALPAPADAWVHQGATSQDVLDTALVLVGRDAGRLVVDHLRAAALAAADLAATHRDSLAVARTLGQAALPTTFGVRAAGWASALDAAAGRLDRALTDELAVQLGGAVGTLSALGEAGLDVVDGLAQRLDLPAPAVPWHTDRGRVHALAAALASAVAVCGKVAGDVVLLSATEVGELAEGGGDGHGGSSAMPHKRNPATSVLVVAAARRAPGLLSTLLVAGVQEQERGTGSWHAEWEPLRQLVRLAGGAAARTADVLAHLDVDVPRMRANLAAAGPGVLAEQLAVVLAPGLGRGGAREAVQRALATGLVEATGRDAVEGLLADLLVDDEVGTAVAEGRVDEAALAAAVDPRASLGSAGAVVDRVVARVTGARVGGAR